MNKNTIVSSQKNIYIVKSFRLYFHQFYTSTHFFTTTTRVHKLLLVCITSILAKVAALLRSFYSTTSEEVRHLLSLSIPLFFAALFVFCIFIFTSSEDRTHAGGTITFSCFTPNNQPKSEPVCHYISLNLFF